jgi:hypothetical protein
VDLRKGRCRLVLTVLNTDEGNSGNFGKSLGGLVGVPEVLESLVVALEKLSEARGDPGGPESLGDSENFEELHIAHAEEQDVGQDTVGQSRTAGTLEGTEAPCTLPTLALVYSFGRPFLYSVGL